MSWFKALWRWWLAEGLKICPNCGYYCHGKSAFCLPPGGRRVRPGTRSEDLQWPQEKRDQWEAENHPPLEFNDTRKPK